MSRLRNLEVETNKQVKDMPITYDITKDGLYKEGIAIGRENSDSKLNKQQKKAANAFGQLASGLFFSIPALIDVVSILFVGNYFT